MKQLLDTMARRVLRHTDGIRTETPVPRVGIAAMTAPTAPACVLYEPAVCVILQGAKQVTIGDKVLRYDTASCFIVSLDLPASGQVVEASAEKPYLTASLGIDREVLAELMPLVPASPATSVAPGFAVAPVDEALLSAWDNLLELLDRPEDAPVLAPLREREVLYRLLQGSGGEMLRQLVRGDSRLAQVRRAIRWIHGHYREPVRIEALADIAGMSVPSFHRQFKAATAMSPIQFQKMLRLQAARRLLATQAEASRAAYAVGYESASQFSREYARMFGLPPSRDAERLRGELVAQPAAI